MTIKEKDLSVDMLNSKNGFSLEHALLLAQASQLAYKDTEPEIKEQTQAWGFDTCSFFESRETQGFITSSKNAIVISFRGTRGWYDWMRNFRIGSEETNVYGTVHRGFHTAYKAVAQTIESVLEITNHQKNVWLTGHSLGGALATMAAAELKGKDIAPIHSIYTFGQPAVGRDGFQMFVDYNYPNKFFRFVNENDIVPKTPPNYRHVGRLCHFGGYKKLALATPAGLGALSSGSENSEISMLTEAEFNALLEKLEKRDADTTEQLNGLGSLGAFIPLSKLIPGADAHDIMKYIGAIRSEIAG